MHFLPICSHLSFTSNMHSSFSCCCRQFALTLKHFWPAQIYLLWKVNPRKIGSAFMLTLIWYFWSYIGVRYFLVSEFLYFGSFFFPYLGSGFSRDPISGSDFFWRAHGSPGLGNRGTRYLKSMSSKLIWIWRYKHLS